ncbi:hypothetical protein FACS1894205_1740 [Alphaproteobacteria bacterium]|nr:hypothetical protein FACS1894205_1740 [Alphaproteobacteria bacterium]
MSIFYSPSGNPEIWTSKPNSYVTSEEWNAAHQPPAAAGADAGGSQSFDDRDVSRTPLAQIPS